MLNQPLRWLGGKIDVRVQVATGLDDELTGLWDEGLWDEALWGTGNLGFQDISDKTYRLTITRGKERWHQRFTAGSLTLYLDNTTGIFNPEGGENPIGQVLWRPGRIIRVIALPDPTDQENVHTLFTGRIDSSKDLFLDGAQRLETLVTAVDSMGDWHANDPPMMEVATGVQGTHERVEDALDRADWPEEARDIQEGLHTMQTSFLAQTTLEECQRAAEAEGGAFFSDVNGKAVFKARDWLITDERSIDTQGFIGYDPTDVPGGKPYAQIASLETSWELGRIRNDIQFARVGGEAYRTFDADSVQVYGQRTHRQFDFRNNSDAEIEFLADRYLAALHENRFRVDSVTIAANADPDNEDLNRLFYDAQFGDLIALKVRTAHNWDFEKETHLIGITHNITADDWTARFALDDAAIAAAGEDESS